MFSIIIPTHKRSHLLKRAIDSIKRQLCSHEIIVVSDVDCIDTFNVCKAHLGSGDYFVFLKNGKGPTDSRNAGIKIASSQFTIFLDDDDYFDINFLSSMVKYVQNSSEKSIYYCNFMVDNSRELTPCDLSARNIEDLEVKNFILNNCIIYPTEAIKQLCFNHIQYEDWDFLLQSTRLSSLRHIPIYGPIVYKKYVDTVSRGEENANHQLIDCYRYIYKKFPPKSNYIEQERKRLFNSIGLEIF